MPVLIFDACAQPGGWFDPALGNAGIFAEDFFAAASVVADDVEARGVQDAEGAPDAAIVESDFQDITVDATAPPADDVEARTVIESEVWTAEEAAAGEISQPPDEVEFLAHESIAEAAPEPEVVASDEQRDPDEVEFLARESIAELGPDDQVVDSDLQDVTVDAQAAQADDVEARGVVDAEIPPDDVVPDSDVQEPVVAAQVAADDVEARTVVDAESVPEDEVTRSESSQAHDEVEFPLEAFGPDAAIEDLQEAQAEISGIIDQVLAVADLIESIGDGLELLELAIESLDQADLIEEAAAVVIAGQPTRPMPGEEGGRFAQTGGERPAVTGGSRPAQAGGSRPVSGNTSRSRVTR